MSSSTPPKGGQMPLASAPPAGTRNGGARPPAPAPLPVPATQAAPARVLKLNPSALAALRSGNVGLLVRSLGMDLEKMPADVRAGIDQLAHMLVEIRRENVAVLGDHEAFVRRTPSGSLFQVLKPVRLSIHDGSLFRLPAKKRPYYAGTDKPFKGDTKKAAPGTVEWRETEVSKKADVTYPGFLRLNGVAGCAVGQPPTVIVDGEPKTNPYVQRGEPSRGKGLGDIQRVVIGVTVVGPAPATGNPVVVNYTLEYDPAKDLQHMLAAISEEHGDDCYLIDEPDFEPRAGWKFTPVFGGVGYAYNLRLKDVNGAYSDFIQLLQNAVKKAQTVARRNAMKAHPALAVHAVEVGEDGTAVVPVIGWTGDDSAIARWHKIQEALSRGMPIPEAETLDGTIDVEEVYDPEKHARTGEVDLDVGAARPREPEVVADPEAEEKHNLIAYIDQGLGLLDPQAVAELGYDPATQGLEELKAVRTRLDTAVRQMEERSGR